MYYQRPYSGKSPKNSSEPVFYGEKYNMPKDGQSSLNFNNGGYNPRGDGYSPRGKGNFSGRNESGSFASGNNFGGGNGGSGGVLAVARILERSKIL